MNHQSVLDEDAIRELREVAGDELSAVLKDYISNGRTHEQRLLDACAQRDWDQVASTAHNIKGSYGYVGALRLVQLCMQVLETVRQGRGDNESLTALTHELVDEFRQVRQAIDSLIKSSSGEEP